MTSEQSAHRPAELAELLRERIKRTGPMTFHDWMQAALYDPQYGYYCRRDRARWGRAGDYRTCPERTPLFAATLARYFFNLFQELDQPSRWTIVEAGAGEGHFAQVVLQTLEHQFVRAFEALNYVIDETSEASIAVARDRLAQFGDRISFEPLARLERSATGIIFSNELFDAFPIHRVTIENGKLRELYVTLVDDGEFVWTSGELSTPGLSEYFDVVGAYLTHEGQIAEVNLDLGLWMAEASRHLARGYLVTIDYGDEAAHLLAPRGTGTPPVGSESGTGVPPVGSESGTGVPPVKSESGTGFPPVGSESGTGVPPVKSESGTGFPPVGSESGTGVPPVKSESGTGVPPVKSESGRSHGRDARATHSAGTLRAYRRHQFQDVLAHPGESDLTTTVDWTYAKKLGERLGFETVLFERLDKFLLGAGLLDQLELMTQQAEEADKASLRAGARELILPTAMAASFQILVQRLVET